MNPEALPAPEGSVTVTTGSNRSYSRVMRMIQVAQRADDLERATRFYADLLGAEPVAT